MPTYNITGPDGKKYRVTGPPGSTPEQALERVQGQVSGRAPTVAANMPVEGPSMMVPPSPPQAGQVPTQPPGGAAPLSGPDAYAGPRGPAGVAMDVPTPENRAAPLPSTSPEEMQARLQARQQAENARMEQAPLRDKITQGVTQPFRGISQNIDQFRGEPGVDERIADSRGAMQGAGAAGMVGNIISNVGLTAAPAAGIQSAIAGLVGKAGIPAFLSQAAGAGGSAAAMSLATEPLGAGESRGGNMAKDGMYAAALDMLLRGGGKALSGMFKPNADAKALLKEGITPPLTTGTDNPVGKGLGRATEVFSTALDASKAPSRVRADQQTVAALLRRADPKGTIKVKPGEDIRSVVVKAVDNVQNELDTALKGKWVDIDSQFGDDARKIIDNKPGLHQESRDTAHEALVRHFQPGKQWGADSFNKSIGPGFNAEIELLEKSGDPMKVTAGRTLREVQPLVRELRDRNVVEQGVDIKALRQLDDAYETAMRLQGASASSVKRSGITTVDLNRELQKASTARQFARGEAHNQDLTDIAADLIDRGRVGNPMFNMAIRAGGYGTSFLGAGPVGLAALLGASRGVQSDAGHKFLFGELKGQKKLADLMRQAPLGGPVYEALKED